jgi:hypothetical protein
LIALYIVDAVDGFVEGTFFRDVRDDAFVDSCEVRLDAFTGCNSCKLLSTPHSNPNLVAFRERFNQAVVSNMASRACYQYELPSHCEHISNLRDCRRICAHGEESHDLGISRYANKYIFWPVSLDDHLPSSKTSWARGISSLRLQMSSARNTIIFEGHVSYGSDFRFVYPKCKGGRWKDCQRVGNPLESWPWRKLSVHRVSFRNETSLIIVTRNLDPLYVATRASTETVIVGIAARMR